MISRSVGRSAVACAAYRAREKLQDERTGEEFDYTRKQGVQEAFILAPEGAPEWVQDRGELWNRVEASEKRCDSQLARELNVSLPHELTAEQRRSLIEGFAREQFVDQGMIADVAIHQSEGLNHHAHIMLTLREVGPEGFGKKVREWNKPEMLQGWRREWATAANRELELAGHQARIDHRTLRAQREEALEKGDYERAIEFTRAPRNDKTIQAVYMNRRRVHSDQLERIAKERPGELALYRDTRERAQGILGELREVQERIKTEPEDLKNLEAAQEKERLEQELRNTLLPSRSQGRPEAKKPDAYEVARTNRKEFDAQWNGLYEDFTKERETNEGRVAQRIELDQRTERKELDELRGYAKDLQESHDWFEEETKKTFWRHPVAVTANFLFYRKEIDRNIKEIDLEREKVGKDITALSKKLDGELDPEKVRHEAEQQTWKLNPELVNRYNALEPIRKLWEQRDQTERRKQWEMEQKQQERDGGFGGLPRGLGRGRDDGIER